MLPRRSSSRNLSQSYASHKPFCSVSVPILYNIFFLCQILRMSLTDRSNVLVGDEKTLKARYSIRNSWQPMFKHSSPLQKSCIKCHLFTAKNGYFAFNKYFSDRALLILRARLHIRWLGTKPCFMWKVYQVFVILYGFVTPIPSHNLETWEVFRCYVVMCLMSVYIYPPVIYNAHQCAYGYFTWL